MATTAYKLLKGTGSRAEPRPTRTLALTPDQEALVVGHLWLVPARCRAIGILRSQAAWDDALQEGAIAMMGSARRYDLSRGVPFEHFARPAIDGAVKAFLCGLGPVYEPVCRVKARIAQDLPAHPVTTGVDELAAEHAEDDVIDALDRAALGAWLGDRISEMAPAQASVMRDLSRGLSIRAQQRERGVKFEETRLSVKAALEYLRAEAIGDELEYPQ